VFNEVFVDLQLMDEVLADKGRYLGPLLDRCVPPWPSKMPKKWVLRSNMRVAMWASYMYSLHPE
jgi:hypothetical protein